MRGASRRVMSGQNSVQEFSSPTSSTDIVAGEWVGGWVSEWMSGWVGGWVSEWMSGWVSE